MLSPDGSRQSPRISIRAQQLLAYEKKRNRNQGISIETIPNKAQNGAQAKIHPVVIYPFRQPAITPTLRCFTN